MSLSNKKIPALPEIPEKERTPLVNEILETCSFQKNGLDLKKERRTVTSRFTIPFPLLRKIFLKGADLRAMTITLFKTFKPYNIRFRMQRWQTRSGEYITGKLPEHIKGHYNINLVRYILHQYYHADVTQPLIFEQLLELGIDISSGQVNRIINENKDIFHAEKVGGVLKHGFNPKMVIISDDAGQFNSFP